MRETIILVRVVPLFFSFLSPSLSPNLTLHVCESVKALEV
jgi:hypothetical protein